MRKTIDRLLSLRRDDRGVTAVEFALISPFFFALLFSYFDTGYFMLRQVLLTQAVDKTMRQVRVSDAYVPIEDFVAGVCKRAYILPDCENSVVVHMVQVGTRGVSLPTGNERCVETGAKALQPQMKYDPVTSGQITFLQVCATAPALIPGFSMGRFLARQGSTEYPLVATTAFMGEQ